MYINGKKSLIPLQICFHHLPYSCCVSCAHEGTRNPYTSNTDLPDLFHKGLLQLQGRKGLKRNLAENQSGSRIWLVLYSFFSDIKSNSDCIQYFPVCQSVPITRHSCLEHFIESFEGSIFNLNNS